MKSTRIYALARLLGLATLVICASAALASAQEAYRGRFTLPVEARWGQVVLPPGDYSFTVDHATNTAIVTLRGRTGYVGYVMNQGVHDQQTFSHSELILVRSGGSYTIRALRLADVGLTLDYSAPKSERQRIAQAPQLLERIPVTMGG